MSYGPCTVMADVLVFRNVRNVRIRRPVHWLKWFCEAGGGAHPTKPGWSKPHTHFNPTNLALFRHKITLYRFKQVGLILLQGGLKWEHRAESPLPPHFNHWTCIVSVI